MLRVDYDQLEISAKGLMEERDTFEQCINKMSSIISSLPDVWEAETCDRYVQQYEDLKPSFEATRDLIQEMAEQMTKISANFKDADSNMAGQM